MSRKIPLEEIEEAIEDNRGYCTNCEDFTNFNVEPDAENYECEECGENTVIGVEQAILLGILQ